MSSQRRRLARVAFLGIWMLPALISSGQIYFNSIAQGNPAVWWRLLLFQLSAWYVWALFAPFILYLGRRYPIDRHHWLARCALHLPVSLLTVLIYLIFYVFCYSVYTGSTLDAAWFMATYRSFLLSFFQSHLLVYWAVLGAGHALTYYERFRTEEQAAAELAVQTAALEAQLAQAQLQALKMQMHPHFLFNTLHTISAFVRSEDKQAAIRMVADLSDLLRMTLDQGGRQEIALKEELEFLGRYLDIEQTRFQDRLTVEMDIAPDTLDARTPSLILQPLVENALRHGIARRASAGRLAIRTHRKENTLHIHIYNDAPPGLAEGRPDITPGIGLSNTRTRLEQLYGAEQSLDLQTQDGVVVALMTLPFSRMPDQEPHHAADD